MGLPPCGEVAIIQKSSGRIISLNPPYGLDGDRRKGGVSLVLVLSEKVGSCGHDAKGRPKWNTHKDQVPMRGTGADQPVVAPKPSNGGGAKGLNGSAEGMDQPARGGIHAGSEVVRPGSHDGQESTSDGRNRCLKRSPTLFPNRWSGRRIRRSRRTTERQARTVSQSRRSRPT